MRVGVYISNLNKIGGIETFSVNLCNRTGFDLIFNEASILAIKKIKSANCYHVSVAEKFDYDVIILASANWGKYPDNLKSKYFVQTVHADYEEFYRQHKFIYKKFDRTTHHISVSKFVKQQFEKTTPYKIDKVIYNLLDKEVIPKKEKHNKLSFITLSRFSKEKGFDRILQVAEIMKDVDYVWHIYGDTSTLFAQNIIKKAKPYKQLRFMGVTEKAKEEIVKHDYLVQLSDTEGFCYSVYEAISCKVPVITTDYQSTHELVKDHVNGLVIKMDLSNFDIEVLMKFPIIDSFEEKSTEQDWYNFLNQITKNNQKQ